MRRSQLSRRRRFCWFAVSRHRRFWTLWAGRWPSIALKNWRIHQQIETDETDALKN